LNALVEQPEQSRLRSSDAGQPAVDSICLRQRLVKRLGQPGLISVLLSALLARVKCQRTLTFA
jgi:hypothetical protein